MKRFLLVALSVVWLTHSASAFAECTKDGKTYQTGERVGPFTCTADGSWQR